MTDTTLRTSRPLAIRTLRIVGAGGRTIEQTVHCPRRDSAVPAVVSGDGRVLGILSSLDVARWLAHSTGRTSRG
jgi:hypothetical protein